MPSRGDGSSAVAASKRGKENIRRFVIPVVPAASVSCTLPLCLAVGLHMPLVAVLADGTQMNMSMFVVISVYKVVLLI